MTASYQLQPYQQAWLNPVFPHLQHAYSLMRAPLSWLRAARSVPTFNAVWNNGVRALNEAYIRLGDSHLMLAAGYFKSSPHLTLTWIRRAPLTGCNYSYGSDPASPT